MTRFSDTAFKHPPRRRVRSTGVIVWLVGFWVAILIGLALWVVV